MRQIAQLIKGALQPSALAFCSLVGLIAMAPTASLAGHHESKESSAETRPDPGRTPAPENAAVYIISPAQGEVVESPFIVRFGLAGAGVAPASVNQPNTGHHHLVIDAPLPDPRVPIPSNDQYRHFGGGQTETMLELPPGPHTLQLIVGDYRHIPHDPPVVSEPIEIIVEAND